MQVLSIALGLLAALPATSSARVAPGVETVPHELLAERPSSYVGREVRLVFQFHSLVDSWNPFLTRFSPSEYIAVRGWSDEQLPWLKADFERLPVRVFVPRGMALEGFFRLGQRHERIAVTCVVREVFAGQPWIEVAAAELLPESIPEGSVLHAIRALDFEEKHAFGLALGELERALAAPLPEHAYEALLQVQKRCIATRDK